MRDRGLALSVDAPRRWENGMADDNGSRRWVWLFVLVPLLPIALVVVLGVGVYDALVPDGPPPDLRERPVRSLATRTVATPLAERTGCGLVVSARSAGAPGLAEVDVVVEGVERGLGSWQVDATTEATGVVALEDLPCGDVRVGGEHPELAAPGAQQVRLLPGERPDLTLMFAPAVDVVGTVRSGDGEPLEGAAVTVQDDGTVVIFTDDRGRYAYRARLHDMERSLLVMHADALGYGAAYQRRTLSREPVDAEAEVEPEGEHPTDWMPSSRIAAPRLQVEAGDEIVVDFVLEPVREVRVWCAGLPDDRCNDMLVQCTHPFVPAGGGCEYSEDTGETVCRCDGLDGRVAIRGGGESTVVQVDEQEAWLDFRSAGSIVGRVVASGDRVTQCSVVVVRVPSGLEDLPRGMVVAQKATCDVEGRFEIAGLVDGDWELVVESHVAGLGSVQRLLEPTRVRSRRTTDVGDVELTAGGGIEGRVVDGLTGEADEGAPVLALKRGQGSGRSTPFFAEVGGDGGFEFEGLPPGEWELSSLLSPHLKTHVTVEDGAITDGVVVETSDATALETNGFSLGVVDGELEVGAVEPGSPADDAGLLPGDRVDGLLVAGLDLGSHLGEHADQFMQLVLGHWDGPGITLVVEREGELHEVELDW